MDIDEVTKYLCEILPQAGRILLKYFSKKNYSQHHKGKLDVGTEADIASEEFLKQKILAKFPKALFLAEETATGDYLSFKHTKNLFVIDPLDGTMNFTRGNPNFAISVALVNASQSILGVCYAPVSGDLYWAQEDKQGAYCNGRKIRVSLTNKLNEASFACDWVPYNLDKRLELIEWLKKVAPHVRQIKSMGCAVNDSLSLAKGVIDVYLNPGLKPWDVAATSLIVKKAGGVVSDPIGHKWHLFESDLLMTNSKLYRKVVKILKF